MGVGSYSICIIISVKQNKKLKNIGHNNSEFDNDKIIHADI